jgi:cell division protease FtsH
MSRNLALWVIVALLVFALFNLFQGTAPQQARQQLAYSEFMNQVEAGEVREVTIKGRQITGLYRDGRPLATFAPEDPELISAL